MSCIPKFMQNKQFKDAMSKQKMGFSFSVYSQYLNLTCWVDRGLVWFADNDFDGDTEEFIAAKLNDKKQHVYHGYRKVIIANPKN